MKVFWLHAALAVLICAPTYPQGQVLFSNHLPPLVEAPVALSPVPPQGYPGPGRDYSAQLLLVGENGSLTPLLPTTIFRAPSGAIGIATQYWIPVTVAVPGTTPGDIATFVVRGWLTSAGSYDAAPSRGQSAPFTVTLGDQASPAALTTLQPFTVSAVPEPPVIAFGLLGMIALVLRSVTLANGVAMLHPSG